MRYPVFEAQFQRDKKNRLRLYDCLVPYILEHEKIDKVDVELENGELQATVNEQKERLKQANEELEIINFKIMQVEDGVDTKTIMQNYVVAKARLENAEKDLRNLEKKYERDVTNGTSRIKEL